MPIWMLFGLVSPNVCIRSRGKNEEVVHGSSRNIEDLERQVLEQELQKYELEFMEEYQDRT